MSVIVTIPPALITLLLGMGLVLAGLWIGYNVSLLPVDASVNAPIYDDLFKVLFSIGTVLFLGIVGLLVFSLVRFRRQPGDQGDGEAIEGNLPLEILWTAVPAIVVLFVGIYSYDIYERMGGMATLNPHAGMNHGASAHQAMQAGVVSGGDGERLWGGIARADGSGEALPVEVSAMQFAFIFHYPDGDITTGELHVPSDRPVELRMEARDVIHAFWVPQFRIKQDVIPGQPTVLSFTATQPGSYPIVCAELCGPYHGGMRSTVVVHPPDEFEKWLTSNRPAAPPTVASAALTPTA